MLISTDITSLTQEQREMLAGFIMTFPHKEPSQIVIPNGAISEADLKKIESDKKPQSFHEQLKASVAIEEEPNPAAAFALAPEERNVGPNTITKTGPVLVIPSPPQATGVVTDKAGLPWDERIHASSHAVTADGNWRRKRGVDDAYVVQVESELRRLMAVPNPTPAAVVIPPPPVESAAVPSVPSETMGAMSFADLVNQVSAAVGANKLSIAEVKGISLAAGLPDGKLELCAARPDLIPVVSKAIVELIAGR